MLLQRPGWERIQVREARAARYNKIWHLPIGPWQARLHYEGKELLIRLGDAEILGWGPTTTQALPLWGDGVGSAASVREWSWMQAGSIPRGRRRMPDTHRLGWLRIPISWVRPRPRARRL